ncbi:MAG TPA: hypothetical protein VH643_22310 [Gemmataceae bacterium]
MQKHLAAGSGDLLDEESVCGWCGGKLRCRAFVCETCVPASEPYVSTVVGPSALLTRHGTLKADPRYWDSPADNKSNGGRDHVDNGDDFWILSGVDERPELARWYASCGLSVEEIADCFRVESLGRWRRSVSVATVRDWLGLEQETVRRMFLGGMPMDEISARVGLRPDTVRRKLIPERAARKEIRRGIAAVLVQRSSHTREWIAARTGLSRSTLKSLKTTVLDDVPLTLPPFPPELLDAATEALAERVDGEMGPEERAALSNLARLLYVAVWATEGAILGLDASIKGADMDKRLDLEATVLRVLEAVERIEEIVVGLAKTQAEEEVAREALEPLHGLTRRLTLVA